jgi:6-pyruvoyltetrahydropterin/6-carboxytetrahydropterin synthase
MYRLCFQRSFTARHFLVGGDWGPENAPHAHAYRIEWEMRAPDLDAHGYLVDLIEVERSLGDTLARYEGALLNELAEFEGRNPSLERFVKVLWEQLAASLPAETGCSVRLWENDSAWAGYDEPRPTRS